MARPLLSRLPPGRGAGWSGRARFPYDAFEPQLLPELVGGEAGVQGAQAGVGVRQGPEVAQGQLRGPQGGVHVRLPQHRLGQLRTPRLRKQQPEEGTGGTERGEGKQSQCPYPSGFFDVSVLMRNGLLRLR